MRFRTRVSIAACGCAAGRNLTDLRFQNYRWLASVQIWNLLKPSCFSTTHKSVFSFKKTIKEQHFEEKKAKNIQVNQIFSFFCTTHRLTPPLRQHLYNFLSYLEKTGREKGGKQRENRHPGIELIVAETPVAPFDVTSSGILSFRSKPALFHPSFVLYFFFQSGKFNLNPA